MIRNSKNKESQMEEYYRLLYVALTRAEDQLHIFGNGDTNYSEKSWYAKILNHLMLTIGFFFRYKFFGECLYT